MVFCFGGAAFPCALGLPSAVSSGGAYQLPAQGLVPWLLAEIGPLPLPEPLDCLPPPFFPLPLLGLWLVFGHGVPGAAIVVCATGFAEEPFAAVALASGAGPCNSSVCRHVWHGRTVVECQAMSCSAVLRPAWAARRALLWSRLWFLCHGGEGGAVAGSAVLMASALATRCSDNGPGVSRGAGKTSSRNPLC